MHVKRAVAQANSSYNELPWKDRWEGTDGGLIACWERGRQKSLEDPALAQLARQGELVMLPWKGGVETKLKAKQKFGSLFYLAMWQGLRGDSLDISPDDEVTLICTRTEMQVVYTPDTAKYDEA